MNFAVVEIMEVADAFKREGIAISENEDIESLLWKANSVGYLERISNYINWNSLKYIRRKMRLYMIFGFWPNH